MLSTPLLSPHDLKKELPASPNLLNFVQDSRGQIKKILEGKDSRLLLIIGPCSIHDIEATLEYAEKLKMLARSVSDAFYIAMRVYFEKPRSLLGWKGFLYDPHLNGSDDIATGISHTRQLLLKLAELQLPVASEFLDPLTPLYFEELISWGCIGARTSTSQIHRQMASSFSFPTGFKNNTDGNIDVAISGILAAAAQHTHLGINDDGKVSIVKNHGNPDCHIVLRGSDQKINYDPFSIQAVVEKLIRAGLPPRVIIDCSHGNSCRKEENQPVAFHSLLHQVVEGNAHIRGILLESYLFAGNQPLIDPKNLLYGVSITDACMSWQTTETLVHWAYSLLKKETSESLPRRRENCATPF